MQKTYWCSRAQSGKFWWFSNRGSQSSWWRMWITKRSSIRCCGTRRGNSVVTILPVQNKNFSGKPRIAHRSSWSRRGKPKVIYTDHSLEFGKSCEELSWIIVRQHHTDQKRMGLLRVKEGTSAELLQTGLGEKWWADSMECYCYLRNIQDLLSFEKRPYERRFGIPFNGPVIPFGCKCGISPYFCKWPIETIINLVLKSCQVYSSVMCCMRGESGKGDITIADFEELEEMDASELHASRLKRKGSVDADERRQFYIPSRQMEQSKPLEIDVWNHPP